MNLVAAAVLAFSILFCRCLHDVAEAAHAAEHRHRRRGGRVSGGHRLGRGDRAMDPLPLILFAIVFFWTPPHFWSLALYAATDYQQAGVPMLPVVNGAKQTRRNVLSTRCCWCRFRSRPGCSASGRIYGLAALTLGVGFIGCVWRVYTDKQDAAGVSLTNDTPARAAFKFSLLYLFVLFAALAVDRLVG